MRKLMAASAVLLFCTSASAQWSDVNAVNPIGFTSFPLDGQPISSFNPNVLAAGCNTNLTACGTVGINIQDFAEASPVNTQFANVQSSLASMQAKLSSLASSLG